MKVYWNQNFLSRRWKNDDRCQHCEDETARLWRTTLPDINRMGSSLTCGPLERSAHASQQDIRLLCFRIIVFRDGITKHQKNFSYRCYSLLSESELLRTEAYLAVESVIDGDNVITTEWAQRCFVPKPTWRSRMWSTWQRDDHGMSTTQLN